MGEIPPGLDNLHRCCKALPCPSYPQIPIKHNYTYSKGLRELVFQIAFTNSEQRFQNNEMDAS